MPMLNCQMAFLVRQRRDRHIWIVDGQQTSVPQWAAYIHQQERPYRWPSLGTRMSVEQRAPQIDQRQHPERWTSPGWTHGETAFLPEAPGDELLLALFWRQPNGCPLVLWVSPQLRRPGRTGISFLRAYRRQWGVQDCTWAIVPLGSK